MVDEQEQQIEKVIDVKTKNKEKLFRVIGTLVSIVILIILIIVKSQRPEFPLFWFLGFILLIIVFFISMFWGFSVYRKYKEAIETKDIETKLPKAITIEQARVLIRELLVQPQYSDYECGWLQNRIWVCGENVKSRILVVQLSPTPYSVIPYQWFVMNLHFPKELYSYFTQVKYNLGEVIRVANNLAIDPKESPDTEKRIETNLQTGIKTEYVKHSKHEKEKTDKKKEDLV